MATLIPLAMAFNRSRLLALAVLATLGCRGPAPDLAAYPFTAAQRQAVARTLRAHPGWRLATRADNTAPDLATVLKEQPDYEPYFARATNRPAAHADFALALVRDGNFAVYWFRATDGGYAPGQEVTVAGWLHDGGLRFRGDELEVAPFHSDEIFAFRWPPHAARPALVPPDSDSGP